MKIHFWGTRGSLPASVTSASVRRKIVQALSAARGARLGSVEAIERFLDARSASGELPFSVVGTYGVNTSCMEIAGGSQYVLCDAGTGLRDFGEHVLRSANGPAVFNIFMSHLHWDHIQGFPFFLPAYRPGNRINIYGLHNELEKAFTTQQDYPFFPVPLHAMAAEITFTPLEPDRTYDIAGFTVHTKAQNHPGVSYGYRFERDGRSLVYSTDCEHKADALNDNYSFLDFFADADLLVFEAQYQLAEAISSKENWGHSSNIMAVEFSVRSRVKRLCLFHNEPAFDDETLDKFLDDTRRYLKIYAESYPLIIDLAYDGLEIEI